MMDSLLHQLEAECLCCAYADDLLLMVEGQSRLDIERKGGILMGLVGEWGLRVGVDVAMDKTVCMLLKGRLAGSRPPIVRMNGVSLKYATEVKYLGLTMSERMCFIPHLVHLREKLVRVVGQVRRVLRSDWGLSRRSVRIIYEGLFVACATYGSAIWCETVQKAVGQKRILACQRVCLLASLPVCRTVSTAALQVLLGVPPLDLVVRQRAVSFKLRRGLDLLPTDLLYDDGLIRECRDWKLRLKDLVLSMWQSRWNECVHGRVTYRYIGDVTFVTGNPGFGFNLCLGFLLTGHGPFNAFLHNRRLATSAGCRCGAQAEDWIHVLCECPLYSDMRCLNELGIRQISGEWDVSPAISTSEVLAKFSKYACELFKRRRMSVID